MRKMRDTLETIYIQWYIDAISGKNEDIDSILDMREGQPSVHGTGLTVREVVIGFRANGNCFLSENNISLSRLAKALEYCSKQKCCLNALAYCDGCNLSKTNPGEDVWLYAKQLLSKR